MRNTDKPLISIIMPAFNAANFIEDSINSIIEQDYTNIELIVVDDGSTDGTPEIALGFGSKIRILYQKNSGPAAARNLGLSVARGEFVAFLDADDIWLPGKLSHQVIFLQNNLDIDFVFGSFLRWESQPDSSFLAPPIPKVFTNPVSLVPEHSGWIYNALLFDNVTHIITAMVRRNVIEKVGNFDETLPTGEDYDFWLRVSRHFRAAKIDATHAYYRIHASSITKTPKKENNEYKVLLKNLAMFGATGPDGIGVAESDIRNRLFQLCFSHGYFHIRSGDAKVAQDAFRAALGHSPWQPKVWAYWLMATVKRLF